MTCATILPDACWIWPRIAVYLNNSYAGFRHDFEQDSLPSAAPFIITADQSCKLHVNGQYVCRGPMRGQQSNWHYDIVDILPYLKLGHHWIAIEAHNPGCSTFLQLNDTDAVFNDDIYTPGFAHLGKTLHDTALRILFGPAAA